MTTTPDTAGTEAPETPRAAARERRLHPWSWLFVLIGALRQFVLPLAALLFFGGRSDGNAQLAIAGCMVVLLAAASIWRYFTWRYRIEDDSLFVRSGVLQRELRQVPFSRIHNVALHQSLLHRLFGVAEVKLESAGGTTPEAHMRVLALDEALALERLIRHRGQPADAAAQAGAMPAEDRLLALSTGELARLGLISNRGMIVIAGAFALAWQIFPDDAMADALRRLWTQAFAHVGQFAGSWTGAALAVAAFVALALALIRVLSVLLAIARYHGFVLSAQGRRLTVERGLLTRVRASVPRRRIQAWTLREDALHRLFRRRALDIDTAAAQGESGERQSLHELAPIASPDACDALVRRVLPDAAWPPPHWSPLPPGTWWRLMPAQLAFAALLTAGLVWLHGPAGAIGLLWLPWAVLAARRQAAFAGYWVDDRLVAVRAGWWSRHWRFAEIDKLQALQLRQSPLDRRLGTASLWLDTAGSGAMSPPLRLRFLPGSQARALHARLSAEVARRPMRW